jgi:hypothetical protein
MLYFVASFDYLGAEFEAKSGHVLFLCQETTVQVAAHA